MLLFVIQETKHSAATHFSHGGMGRRIEKKKVGKLVGQDRNSLITKI